MAEYRRGTMDMRDREKTFEGFVKVAAWGGTIAILVLIFLALANN